MPVYPNVSFLGHLCQFQTESLPWQPTCESATQTATSDAHSGNIHLCFLYSSKNCTVELYKQPGSPVGPVQLFPRPSSPPSYLPSLSKLWKSPADLQPCCWSGQSENVRCRTKFWQRQKILTPNGSFGRLPPLLWLETRCTCQLQFHRQAASKKIQL